MTEKNLGSTERFGYEWKKYSQMNIDYEKQFLKWIFPLTKESFKKKKVLDAGCGMGRNSLWPLSYGAKEVVSFDYDKGTLESAKKTLAKYKNSKVEYHSIYDIPYKNEFDIAFSIGVIHHLEKPREAIKSLVNATKKNGSVLIWVYGYEGNEFIVNWINPLRKITSKLPLSLTHFISYFFSIPLFIYLKLFKQKREYFKLISQFKFWHIHSIVFDQLIPRIANYWKKEEVLDLMNNQGLNNIRIYPINNMSWTAIGTKMK